MSDKVPAVILIIEDSRSVREEVKRALDSARMKLSFLEAENGLDGFKLLLNNQIDLVLCDLVMPQMDGFKFLKMKASRPEMEEIPVIILTAVDNIKQKVKLLSAGAGDYVVKPFHPGELLARASVHLKRKLLQDELRKKNALLTELSTTDGLTRIFNRRHFFELASAEVMRSHRMNLPVSLLIFDVDHFKAMNDTLGHQVGDSILYELCVEVKRTLRVYDIFGRYGGDEFIVLFPHTVLKEAAVIANRLREGIAALNLKTLKGRSLSVTGGVAFLGKSGSSLEELIRAADKALYVGKTRGRDRIQTGDEA